MMQVKADAFYQENMMMKKIAMTLCLVGATFLSKADLVADWNFNQTPAAPSPTPIAASGGAEAGAASLDLSHLAYSFDATIGSSSSGTSVNKIANDETGESIFIVGGTGDVENGKSIIFTLSMSGYQGLVLTYATDRTSTGFNQQAWSYSTDGGITFNPSSSITSISNGFTTATVNFSSAVDNDSSVLIELTLNGASSSSGSDHFDNMQFNANDYFFPVPESAAYGLISALGLLAICSASIWRWQRAARRA
jgi:hypothetical protein